MRARTIAAVALLLLSIPALAREKKIYFSVTTSKTFRPNEKPKIQLYAHDVDVLEFRVYRVQDPLAFFQKLDDVHRFGPQWSPPERVEERTWLERFHDWKMSWWRRSATSSVGSSPPTPAPRFANATPAGRNGLRSAGLRDLPRCRS